MSIPESIKELRPHFTFKAIEIFFECAGGAGVLAATAHFLGAHLDALGWILLFVASAGMLGLVIWNTGRRARSAPVPPSVTIGAPSQRATTSDEDRLLRLLRAEFDQLTWLQKAAVKLLRSKYPEGDTVKMVLWLEALGITDHKFVQDKVVNPVCAATELIDYNPQLGSLLLREARMRTIDKLLNEWDADAF